MKIKFKDLYIGADLILSDTTNKSNFLKINVKKENDNSETFYLQNCFGEFLCFGNIYKDFTEIIISNLYNPNKNHKIWFHVINNKLFALKYTLNNLLDDTYEISFNQEYNKLILINISLPNLITYELIFNILDRIPFSEGSYGLTYANPRLLCKNETIIPTDEISKVFKNHRSITNMEEYVNNIYSIKDKFDNNAENFLILPKCLCDIDLQETKKSSIFIFLFGQKERNIAKENFGIYNKHNL